MLFRNLRDGRFEDVTGQAGAVFKLSESGRGAAFGDIDNDGDMDVLVGNDGGRVRLLVNNLGSRNHWLGLRLVGKTNGRDMLGARVIREPRRRRRSGVARDPTAATVRRTIRACSWASASSAAPATVKVRWPDGHFEEWSDVAIDRWTTLKEGTGR